VLRLSVAALIGRRGYGLVHLIDGLSDHLAADAAAAKGEREAAVGHRGVRIVAHGV